MEERPFRACPEPVEGAALRVTEEKASGPVAHLPALGLSGSTQALQRRTMPPINLAPRVPNPCRRHPERSRPSGEARDLPRIDTGRARPSSRLIRKGCELARARFRDGHESHSCRQSAPKSNRASAPEARAPSAFIIATTPAQAARRLAAFEAWAPRNGKENRPEGLGHSSTLGLHLRLIS